MYKYKFYCKKCGYYKEFPKKEDVRLEKKAHKRRRCSWVPAPHKDMEVLARPELAMKVRLGDNSVD
jgi:hypothetical protein